MAEEEKVCHVCSDFEPQAWRKSLCRNCFHTLEDHSEELLAAEAEAVAKEKAAEKDSQKSASKPPPKSEGKGSGVSGKGKELEKGSGEPAKNEKSDSKGKDIKSRLGGGKDFSSKGSPWKKDLGVEYGKPSNKASSKDTAVTSGTSSSSTATTTSSSTPSTKSSKTSSDAPSSSTSSSPPATTTTTTTTDAETKGAGSSKAKSFASKFENKQSTPADKPGGSGSKPTDLRFSSSSVSSLTGKLSKDANTDSKSTAKPDDSKSIDSSKDKAESLISDSKSKSPSSKSPLSKTAVNGLDKTKDDKGKKDFLSSSRSKNAAPFGKDMLKSTKKDNKSAVPAKESEKETSVVDKDSSSVSSKTKDSPTSKAGSFKSPSSAFGDTKPKFSSPGSKFEDKLSSKNNENDKGVKTPGKTSNLGQSSQAESKSSTQASASSSSPSSPSSQTEGKPDAAKINRAGQLAKYLPGKLYGQEKTSAGTEQSSGSKASDSAPSAGDVSKTAGKAEKSNDAGSSPTTKKSEFDKSPLLRDKDKEKEVKVGEGKKAGESGAKAAAGPSATPSGSLADSKSSSSVVGSQSTPAKTSGSSTTTTASSSSITTKTTASSLDSIASPSSTKGVSKANDSPAKPKDLRLGSDTKPVNKFKELDKKTTKKDEGLFSPLKSPSTSVAGKQEDKNVSKAKTAVEKSSAAEKDESNEITDTLRKELKEKEEKLEALVRQVSKMEGDMQKMEKEKEKLTKEASQTRQSQKDDVEKLLQELRGQLQKMETQCQKLQTDNEKLTEKLHSQEDDVKKDQEKRGKNESNVQLEEDLELTEKELEDVKEENKELQREIMELKNEMDEMHDHFRENEHDEFRELQKELDMTAKNCRILQFKLRKAERRNEQIEEDRVQYEDKLRKLQDQFDSQDAKDHIHLLEEELRMAKEVSVRLHDELDIVEDKKNKALEENRHLTELLEHTDKRQFRLEMEIDKLRDIVQELKMQLREAKGDSDTRDGSSERKVPSYIYTRSMVD